MLLTTAGQAHAANSISRPDDDSSTGYSPLKSVAVNDNPRAVAVTSDGAYAYVANFGSDNLTVIDLETYTTVKDIAVGDGPSSLVIASDNSFLAVAHFFSDDVLFIDLKTDAVGAGIKVGSGPVATVLSPDDRRLYVAASMGRSISVIDTTTREPIGVISLGDYPHGLAIAPDGRRLYVAVREKGSVVLIDLATNELLETTVITTGFPRALTLSPDGKRLYVADYDAGRLLVVDAEKMEVVYQLEVGAGPIAVNMNADGSKVFVVNRKSSTLGTADLLTTHYSEVGLGAAPSHIALVPDTSTVLVTASGINSLQIMFPGEVTPPVPTIAEPGEPSETPPAREESILPTEPEKMPTIMAETVEILPVEEETLAPIESGDLSPVSELAGVPAHEQVLEEVSSAPLPERAKEMGLVTTESMEQVSVSAESFEEMAENIYPGAKQLHLSLQDCISAALKHNLDIEVKRFSPEINQAIVQSQQGVFDPHLYFNATHVNAEIPLPASVAVSTGGLITSFETQQWIMAGGVAGAIPTGLTYDASLVSEHTQISTLTDLFRANGEQRFEASLSVTQPLLKNFGSEVNTTGIHVAKINREASDYELEQRILETVFEVEQAYWELVFAYEDLRVRTNSVRLAQDLLDENRIRLKVGVIAPLAVLQSETGVVFREEEFITAQSRVQDARDRLLKVTNLLPRQVLWDVMIIPSDEPFALEPTQYLKGDQIMEALRNRPELKALIKLQEAAISGARFAKNQLLPAFDLVGSIGVVGLDEEYNSSIIPLIEEFGPDVVLLPGFPAPPDKGIDPAFDGLFSGDHVQWMIGFKFEMPWGRHTERGQYRSANLQVSQLDDSIRNLRQLIIQDTRNALRRVRTSWEQKVLTKETTRFRLKTLEAENKKYEVGVSTAHDVLQFEEELASAQAREKRADIDYTLSLSNLLRATGNLLQVRNVQVALTP